MKKTRQFESWWRKKCVNLLLYQMQKYFCDERNKNLKRFEAVLKTRKHLIGFFEAVFHCSIIKFLQNKYFSIVFKLQNYSKISNELRILRKMNEKKKVRKGPCQRRYLKSKKAPGTIGPVLHPTSSFDSWVVCSDQFLLWSLVISVSQRHPSHLSFDSE